MQLRMAVPESDSEPERPGTPTTFLAGSESRALAEPIRRALGVSFGACTTERFPDGEVMVQLDESVRGHEVVLLQGTSYPVNDHLLELLALTDACRRAAARHVVAVVPYFGYARSDRRDGRRGPITARLVATMLEAAGVDHLITLDAHTPALEGFFSIPMDNLSAVHVLAAALRAQATADVVVVAPDHGAVHLADRYALALGASVAVCHKQRTGPTTVSVGRITGDVAGRHCVVVDDMISTGSTIVESIRALREAGAKEDILVAATHGVLVPGALTRLAAARVKSLYVTDSIPFSPAGDMAVTVVSVAPIIATAIARVLDGASIRDLT